MNLNFLVKEESRLSDITDKILNFSNSNLFLLYGKMGVGKTTFIKSFCSSLNVIDIVSSPTFSIVNEYKTLEESSVFHFDFFRTNNKNEIFDIGYEEYIFSSSYCTLSILECFAWFSKRRAILDLAWSSLPSFSFPTSSLSPS